MVSPRSTLLRMSPTLRPLARRLAWAVGLLAGYVALCAWLIASDTPEPGRMGAGPGASFVIVLTGFLLLAGVVGLLAWLVSHGVSASRTPAGRAARLALACAAILGGCLLLQGSEFGRNSYFVLFLSMLLVPLSAGTGLIALIAWPILALRHRGRVATGDGS